MKNIINVLVLAILLIGCGKKVKTVEIIVSENADKIEALAANELSKYLRIIYPDYEFPVTSTAGSSMKIFLGRSDNIPDDLLANLTIPANSEGFIIHNQDNESAVISSYGSLGVLYGVYELLNELGYSFVFSGDYAPVQNETFSLEAWDIINEPLVSERTVFNWHNFLSGCSGWDYEDWAMWIDQSQKMGYNNIMVHGYANNPMFTFQYKGLTKKVGYLTTSTQGRDWSTEHVNDIRRLPGGHIFDSAVFGSEAGKVPDNEKIEAVQQLMKRVFQHAEERGMNISFALDFDIVAAIPQEMVAKIPEPDKFLVDYKGLAWMGEKPGPVWLPRPDKPEGYNYYKKQVETLLQLYPEIDKFVLWRRASGSVWDELKIDEIPVSWQKEYKETLRGKPEIAKMRGAAGAFAQSKLGYAYRKAFDEFNRSDIDIAYGTWRWWPLQSMNEFYPEFASIYILDSEIVRSEKHLHNKQLIDDISVWVKKGKLIPVIWAHHDDGAYIGAPLPPFESFSNTLVQLKSNGYGVIHWMTRPFDMFFIHHNRQVQQRTRNQTLEETLADLAQKWFGEANAEIMNEYLNLLKNDMPTFGRETSTNFIDNNHYHQFENVEKIMTQCDERIALLEKVESELFSKDQEETYLYYVDYEYFIKEFYRQQGLFLDFITYFKSGEIDAAKQIADQFQPELVMEKYAETIEHGQATKGEKGLLFSMGVRWVPHFLSLKQVVGKDEVRINFGVTSHENLAQMAGTRTYIIDSDKAYWKVLGEKETGVNVVVNEAGFSEYAEIFKQGVSLDSEIQVKLNAFSRNEKIIAGIYTLKLLLTSKGGSGKLKVEINDSIYALAINGTSIESLDIVLNGLSNPEIKFNPIAGVPVICGMILEIRK